jgi:hypothetical protein
MRSKNEVLCAAAGAAKAHKTIKRTPLEPIFSDLNYFRIPPPPGGTITHT